MDFTKLSKEELLEMQEQIAQELEAREEQELEQEWEAIEGKDPNCVDYDDLSKQEQKEFDEEFNKMYPSVFVKGELEAILAGIK